VAEQAQDVGQGAAARAPRQGRASERLGASHALKNFIGMGFAFVQRTVSVHRCKHLHCTVIDTKT
jgi:hypothetical protein